MCGFERATCVYVCAYLQVCVSVCACPLVCICCVKPRTALRDCNTMPKYVVRVYVSHVMVLAGHQLSCTIVKLRATHTPIQLQEGEHSGSAWMTCSLKVKMVVVREISKYFH